MFGIGTSELVILGLILVVLIGPKQIPVVFQAIAKVVRQFSRLRDDVTHELHKDEQVRNIKESMGEMKAGIEKVSTGFQKELERAMEGATEHARADQWKPDSSEDNGEKPRE